MLSRGNDMLPGCIIRFLCPDVTVPWLYVIWLVEVDKEICRMISNWSDDSNHKYIMIIMRQTVKMTVRYSKNSNNDNDYNSIIITLVVMPICNNRFHHHHHDHHAPRQEIPVEDLRRFENVLSADLSEQVTSRWWTFTPQRLRVTLPQIKVGPENNTVLVESNLSTVYANLEDGEQRKVGFRMF